MIANRKLNGSPTYNSDFNTACCDRTHACRYETERNSSHLRDAFKRLAYDCGGGNHSTMTFRVLPPRFFCFPRHTYSRVPKTACTSVITRAAISAGRKPAT